MELAQEITRVANKSVEFLFKKVFIGIGLGISVWSENDC